MFTNEWINELKDVSEKLAEINQGREADQVFVCTGAMKGTLASLECVEKGGIILFFAVPDPKFRIPVPVTKFWRKEITIRTSYGAAPQDLEEALEILARKRINVNDMITHKLSLQETAQGFRLVEKADNSLKIIVEPNRN